MDRRRPADTKKRNFQQLYLLRRWANAPECSPLSPVPDLWDLKVQAKKEVKKLEQDLDVVVQEEGEFLEEKEWGDYGYQIIEPEQVQEHNEIEAESDQAKLRNEKLSEAIQNWFLENFEPPAPGSSYDEYMWGGPFVARDIITTHFDLQAGYDDGLTEFILEALEGKSTAWVPIGSRLEKTTKSDEPTSPEEAFSRVQKNVRELKELLSRIPEQPAGIGHNRPPEPIDDTPLDIDDRAELAAALQVVESQRIEPADRGEKAKEAAAVIETKMQKVCGWLARQGDTFATEAFKEAGKQFGKWMPRAFWLILIDRMMSVTETISQWLLIFAHI